ncbi:MAG: electron transport complex subunit RsxC [Gammaproteobacteria bacterium]|nr:MAG: electron transport complex subunit RsxC [Gammaproteobacteria bacterium]
MTSNPMTQAEYSLSGGVKLEDNKLQSTGTPIVTCPTPSQLFIPLNMHTGADAKTVIEVGSRVTQYQLIAEAIGNISANVHSPVDGTVADIKMMPVVNRSELDEWVIILDVCADASVDSDADSASSNTHKPSKRDWSKQSKDELLDIIQQAGIVGLGGACFPTHQKLLSSATIDCHTLLLNGAECEPYISCDSMTMVEQAFEIIEGCLILASILNASNLQIAIEDNKPEAISAMTKAADAIENLTIEVITIPTIYPSGGEKQLLEIITGKQVAIGKYPASLGYLVQNIGTALAIYEAVVLDKPLIERIVTVTGEAVKRPGNYRVSFGTSIRHLLDFAGWDEAKTTSLIHGGPMMGFSLPSADRPIVKSSNCIIAGTAEEFQQPDSEHPCIRCGLCAEVCPASLLPQQLFWFSQAGELNKAEDHNIMDCIECGACSYVCPSQIPLVDYYRFTKGEIRTRADITDKAERSKLRFDFRNERLETIKLEKTRAREERKRLAAEKRQQESGSSDSTSNSSSNSTYNSKKDEVAEALARVQAKKDAKIEAMTKIQKDQGNADV